jgi:hypothetical protein
MVKDSQREVSVVSGENGEFSFQGVPAGKYRLSVTERGLSQLYQETEGSYSTAIVTGAGQDTEHIVFPLHAPASLSGSVVDEENDPVPQATVYLFAQSLRAGKDQIRIGGQGATDTAGEFHFRRLPPGTYYVAVAGRPWYAQNMPPGGGAPGKPNSDLDVAYPVTYYLGVTSAESATPIKLEEGTRAEVEFTLHAVPAVHLSMEAQEEGRQRRGIGVTQVGPGGVSIHLPVIQTPTELLGLAPGNYVVDSQAVSVVGDASLRASGGLKTSIKGKVILNGEAPNGWMVALRNTREEVWGSEVVHADGSFEIPAASAGRYFLALMNVPDIYLAKVDVKGAAYRDGELEIAPGAQVELLLTQRHGLTKLEGVVVEDKKPLSGAMVLLIPQDPHHGKTIARDQSDGDGTFAMEGVAPGRYTLVAIDNGLGLAYADAAVIAPYLERGRALDVPVGGDAKVEIEVQRRP